MHLEKKKKIIFNIYIYIYYNQKQCSSILNYPGKKKNAVRNAIVSLDVQIFDGTSCCTVE